MPPASQRRRKLQQGPLSRQVHHRAAGKPFFVYLGVILFVVFVVYANILFRTPLQEEGPVIPVTAPPLTKEQQEEADRKLEWDKQQSKRVESLIKKKTENGVDAPIKKPAAVPAKPAAPATRDKKVQVVPAVPAAGNGVTSIALYKDANCKGSPYQQGETKAAEHVHLEPEIYPQSVQVRGNGLAQVFVGDKFTYKGTVMEVEGCVDLFNLFQEDKHQIKFELFAAASTEQVLTAKRQVNPALQQQFATVKDLSQPHTRFIFSCESSEYFGYQVYANAFGFLKSKQTSASWLRLLTSAVPDDLVDKFPTFTAPRQLYSNFYHPINKADVIDKWMHSPDAPHPEDVLVVIDPDNWLVNDINDWTKRVSHKQALAQRAYYGGNPMLQDLWKEICLNNCGTPLDPAAVPYVLKAADMKEVAPLWRKYSIEIKERFHTKTAFKDKYGPGLGVRWASEMFGYNAACTHLGIKTTIVNDMQIRDVDGGKRQFDKLNGKMPMIHMGRAWFPKDKPELAAPYWHRSNNEPASIAASGIEVWCKCNGTAAYVQPWPLPAGLDFVSYHTLSLLHDSVAKFGPIPINESFRRKKAMFYSWSHP